MSSRVNLNDNTNDKFEFTIGGLDYDLKYPTLEEIEPIQALIKENSAIENNDKLSSEEKEKALETVREKMEKAMYSMVAPVGHTVPIKETLSKQPFPVVKAFNKMMNEQLSAE